MKTFQFGIYDGLFQGFIFELGNLAARSADHVMVSLVVVRTFILRCIAELVLDDQSCINQLDNRIV